MAEICLHGWELVHTYRESHGEYVGRTYQKREDRLVCRDPPSLLVVDSYRDQRPAHVRESSDRDYLLAKQLAFEVGRERHFAVVQQEVSKCATASWWKVEERSSGGTLLGRWHVQSVAGHGEWAAPEELPEEEQT